MRYILAAVVALGSLAVVDTADAHPEVITNCWTWGHGTRNYYGDCSGTGVYQAYAWCVVPGSGLWDYGSIRANGNVTSGQCKAGYTASSIYVRILSGG